MKEKNAPAKRHAVSTYATVKKFGAGSKGKLQLMNISTTGGRFKVLKIIESINKGDLLFISILHEKLDNNMLVYGEVIWVKESEFGMRFMSKAETLRRHELSKIVS